MAPLAVGSVFVWNLKVGWKLWRWSPVRTDSSIKFRLDRLWIRFLDWAVPVVKHFVNTIKIASMSDLLALRFVSKKAPSKRLVPRWPWHYWYIAVRRIELLRWRSAADCCRCWAIFFFFGVFWSYLQNVGIVPLAACVNYLADSTFIDLSSSSEWCSIGGRCGQRWVTFRLYPPLNESEETAMLERTMCFRAAHAVFYSIINNQSKSNGDEFQSMLIESWDEALKSNGRRRQRWTRRWHATDVGDLINATESSDGDIQRIRHWANVSAVAFDTTCFNSASLGTNDVFDDASMASFHHKLKHQSSLLIKKKAVRTAGTNPSGGDSPSSQRRHRVSFKTFSSSAAISQHFNNDILLTIQVIEFVLSLFNRLPLLSRWISVISKLVDSVNFHLLNTALVNQLTALKSKQIIRLNQNQTSPDEYVEFS